MVRIKDRKPMRVPPEVFNATGQNEKMSDTNVSHFSPTENNEQTKDEDVNKDTNVDMDVDTDTATNDICLKKRVPIPVHHAKLELKTYSKRVFREVNVLQNTAHNLLSHASFSRVAREILNSFGKYRIKSKALKCLQSASELYLVNLFDDAYYSALHANRKTLFVRDIEAALLLRDPN